MILKAKNIAVRNFWSKKFLTSKICKNLCWLSNCGFLLSNFLSIFLAKVGLKRLLPLGLEVSNKKNWYWSRSRLRLNKRIDIFETVDSFSTVETSLLILIIETETKLKSFLRLTDIFWDLNMLILRSRLSRVFVDT